MTTQITDKRRRYNKAYYLKTREKRIIAHKEWRKKNRAKWNEYYRKYYSHYREILSDRQKLNRIINKLSLKRITPKAALKQGLITEHIFNKILLKTRRSHVTDVNMRGYTAEKISKKPTKSVVI